MKFDFETPMQAQAVLGERDANLTIIEEAFDVQIFPKGHSIKVKGDGDACQSVVKLFEQLCEIFNRGHSISGNMMELAIRTIKERPDENILDLFEKQTKETSTLTSSSDLQPRTKNQQLYAQNIQDNDLCFAWGPAGTGKTYFAVAMAVEYLKKKLVDRIILTRPAVEAGEKLGFLPGDMIEKVNPYLRPMYDALYDRLDPERVQKFLDQEVIEIAPLAFMRGRTLNKAFVVLDEGQNATADQMKMFLTRLGFDSKAVVTGDVTQIDLPHHQVSGLVDAIEVLRGVEGIGFVEFSSFDVVRHPLVRRIVDAYAKKYKSPIS